MSKPFSLPRRRAAGFTLIELMVTVAIGAVLMMVAATAGGYGGARVARRIPADWLRGGIVLTGLVMAGLFFWRQ